MDRNWTNHDLLKVRTECIADMRDFNFTGKDTNTILFANLNVEWVNLMPTDKQAILDATLAIVKHNKNALTIIEKFTEKEERYIAQEDKEIHKKIIKDFDGIMVENNLFSSKTRKAVAYKDQTVQWKEVVTVTDLQEGLNEMIRLQTEINTYLSIAKKYVNEK